MFQTAFQPTAFQNDAFQIVITPPTPSGPTGGLSVVGSAVFACTWTSSAEL